MKIGKESIVGRLRLGATLGGKNWPALGRIAASVSNDCSVPAIIPLFKQCLKKRLLITIVDNLWECKPIDECVIDIRSCSPRLIPPFLWRECIKRIWEVDQLCYAKCGGEMKIISFIYQRAVIKMILDHLGQSWPHSFEQIWGKIKA